MKFWQELRRRRVFRLAGLYIVAAWLVIQVADVSFPAWGVPETALRWLFVAAAAGFPVALVFAWRYDITPQGIVRTEDPDRDAAVDLRLQRADYVVLAALALIGVVILLESIGKIQDEIEASPGTGVYIERLENSIAVLPFKNLDVNADTGFFSDGITEEILHRLSGLRTLHVLASTSSFAFRNSAEGPAGISEKLGVRYLLTGSVRRDQENVRVTARLLDETGFQVWSDSFDRRLEGIFAIQTEIASTVATQIVNKIVPVQELPAGRTTTNMEAYNAYLAGQAYTDARTTGWAGKAESAFRRAIELDPGFAPPYAGLAIATTVNTNFGPHWEEGRSLAARALELDPGFAYGHAAMGLMLSVLGDSEQGLASLRRGIELDPSLAIAYNWMSVGLRRLGRHDEARGALLRGLEIDPVNPSLIRNISQDESDAGNFDRAEQLLLRLASLPEPAARTYAWLYMLYDAWGRYASAVDVAKNHLRLTSSQVEPQGLEDLALAYAALGMWDDAEYWVAQFRGRLPADDPSLETTLFLEGRRGNLSRLAGELAQVEVRIPVDLAEGDGVLALYAGLANIQLQQYEPGIELVEQVLVRFQGSVGNERAGDSVDVALLDENFDTGLLLFILHRLVYAMQHVGRESDALALLEAIDNHYSTSAPGWSATPLALEQAALNYGLLGDTAKALELLRKAVELGWANYYTLVNDPAWAAIIAKPGFQALLTVASAEVEKQRAIVEAADARHDFRAELEVMGSE